MYYDESTNAKRKKKTFVRTRIECFFLTLVQEVCNYTKNTRRARHSNAHNQLFLSLALAISLSLLLITSNRARNKKKIERSTTHSRLKVQTSLALPDLLQFFFSLQGKVSPRCCCTQFTTRCLQSSSDDRLLPVHEKRKCNTRKISVQSRFLQEEKEHCISFLVGIITCRSHTLASYMYVQ